MITSRKFRTTIVAVTCMTLICPLSGRSAEPGVRSAPQHALQALDLRLNEAHRLDGQLVDSEGQPRASVEIELWNQGQLVQRTITSPEGGFQFQPPRGGTYQVITDGTGCVVRVWQPQAAPPSAKSSLLLVQGPLVRGQYRPTQTGIAPGLYDGKVMKALSNPWVFGGLVAAAIAVPIAISANDGEGS